MRDLGRAAGAQPAAQLRHHHGLVWHAAGDFITAVQQPVSSECHRALPQAPVLDRPHRPAVFTKPNDRRFRHQQRLCEPHRGYVDLAAAKVEVSRQLIELNRDSALFIDAIVFRLDAGNLPRYRWLGCDRRTISAG